MRNYWALLPAIAGCVVLALVYAVPTLIKPQITSNMLALFRSQPDQERAALTPKQIFTKRMAAIAVIVGALALVGFNVSLNREANGCYLAAKAWGADDSKKYDDPCLEMISGSVIGVKGTAIEDAPQPLWRYQLVQDRKPRYLQWITSRPSYQVDILVGVPSKCSTNVRISESDDKILVLSDMTDPCPSDSKISVTALDLERPVGDRKVVTVGDKPMEQINPEMQSWGTVLKKLATGG